MVNQWEVDTNVVDNNPNILLTVLNVNCLNVSIKRYRQGE